MKNRVRFSTWVLCALIVFLGWQNNSFAQINGVDNTFGQTGTGLNATVASIVVQSDGKILVGGGFTTYNGVTQNRVARLNSDGTIDPSFSSIVITGQVNVIAAQPDGKVMVGGHFNNGMLSGPQNYILRLNSDGTLDASFTSPLPITSTVRTIAVLPNGQMLVGGNSPAHLRRLNSNGTVDGTFSPTGHIATIYSLEIQPDGKSIAGTGLIGSWGGIVRRNTNGLADATFLNGTPFNSVVESIAVQPDGKVLVGGQFTTHNGIPRSRIARLNSDGTLDGSFVQTGTGFNNGVKTISLQPNGKILVGGTFTSYNGIQRNSLALLNADGSLDESFNQIGTGLNGSVLATAIPASGKVLVGGTFTNYNGTNRSRIMRFGTDIQITSFSPSFGSQGTTVVITGKSFTGANGVIFGGIPAASFTVDSDTQITAVVGAGNTVTGGQQLVIVTTPQGTASLGGFSMGAGNGSDGTSSGGTGTTQPISMVYTIQPSAFTYGTPVTIRGFGFTNATGVMVGGVPVTNFTVIDDGTATAVIGGVPISDVILATGVSSSIVTFSGIGVQYFRKNPPVIDAMSPSSIPAGEEDVYVILQGRDFLTGANASLQTTLPNGLRFSLSTAINNDGNQAGVILPSSLRSLGVKTITLTNPDGQFASVTLAITRASAPPHILSGTGGTVMIATFANAQAFTISFKGTNIFRTAQAFLDGIPVPLSVYSATQASVEIPASLNLLQQFVYGPSPRLSTLRLVNSDGQGDSMLILFKTLFRPVILGVRITPNADNTWTFVIRGRNFYAGVLSQLGFTGRNLKDLNVESLEGDSIITARTIKGLQPEAFDEFYLLITNVDNRIAYLAIPKSLFIGGGTVGIANTQATSEVGMEAWFNNQGSTERFELENSKKTYVEVSEISIAPNPAQNELYIRGVETERPSSLRIYDMRGVVVLQAIPAISMLNISTLPVGVYMVEVRIEEGQTLRRRIVKQ